MTRKEELEQLVGKKIKIIKMDEEPQYTGRVGVIKSVDDMCQLHGTWGGLAIIDGTDKYKVIK